jgi:hypothetical protein
MMRSGFVRLAVGAAALLSLAGCAAPTSAPSTSPSPSPIAAAPSPSPSPSPAASALGNGTKGYGDTAANPDTVPGSVICTASSSIENGPPIAYLEVAGTDATAGQAVCNTMESVNGGHTWVAVTGGYSLTPLQGYTAGGIATGCYDTMGAVTARIYTAAYGNPIEALALCMYPPSAGGFGITHA